METYITIIGSIVVACASILVIGVALWYFLEWGMLRILQQFKVYEVLIEYAFYRKQFKKWAKDNNVKSRTGKFNEGLNEK